MHLPMFSRTLRKSLYVSIVIVIALLIFWLRTKNDVLRSYVVNQHNQPRIGKTILIWNSPQRLETAPFGIGHEPFVVNRCAVPNCTLYVDPTALPLEEFDAIVLNIFELHRNLPNLNRPEHQRWVFLNHEPPLFLSEDLGALEGLFNWTMSYRKSSDILLRYGYVEPLPSALKALALHERRLSSALKNSSGGVASKSSYERKDVFVAWFVSRCVTDSKREKYVKELEKYIAVDKYGGCGTLSCPRNELTWLSDIECYEMLENKYKFYLSFENSFCTDYVTEKFFYVLNRTVVPVVYGGANYREIAPPYSYINALDYQPRDLANYLYFLHENEDLYREYFWWKEHYKVHVGFDVIVAEAYCELCAKLHANHSVTIHRDVVQEWNQRKHCWTPHIL